MTSLSNVGIVILAAGRGKRMGVSTETPKVLLPLSGKPLLVHLLERIKKSSVTTTPVIVIAPDLYVIRSTIGAAYEYAIQESQLGTGNAVLSAREKLRQYDHILVLYGDHPLLRPHTIDELVAQHLHSNAELTFASVKVPNFDGWYSVFSEFGRLVRDQYGRVVQDVEVKDADESIRAITELNPAYYLFQAHWLWAQLPKVSRQNAQNEYYLTDLFAVALKEGIRVTEVELKDPTEAIGVNTPEQLAVAETKIKEQLEEEAGQHTAKLPL
ncbi:NTP transferase domain-containing protein [Candidatus Uhrbacteria bacterium]|nr:NTP transferase domain-containing protein [Candidatus Uhrbacteria bacterium]